MGLSNYNSCVHASAPTRIDLAGGTIDIWPLYLFHDGACTVNAAISLRAHVDVERRTDGVIELRSIDTSQQATAPHWSSVRAPRTPRWSTPTNRRCRRPPAIRPS